ncbi:hypothetical protein FQA39_LY17083 [Lamprigera yunnana]|nr:hypothetical protein FQA39_LY17083 [Lamprigera yunnana]
MLRVTQTRNLRGFRTPIIDKMKQYTFVLKVRNEFAHFQDNFDYFIVICCANQAREIIYKLYGFMKREKESKDFIIPVDRVYER